MTQKYDDLRHFAAQLQSRGDLKRIVAPVSPKLEMTEICDRTLRAGGPALLFQNPTGGTMPVLGNLFGTVERVAAGMGQTSIAALRDVGTLLARLKEPEPPRGFKDAGRLLSMIKSLRDMAPRVVRQPPCQHRVIEGSDVDLAMLPIQTCWPDDAGPLITWGLVITRGPQDVPDPRKRQNLGIYRQQVISRNEVIMRWLAHRGGALDFREFAEADRKQGRPPSSVPDRGRTRRRPGHHPRCGHAGARHAVRVSVRRDSCAAAAPNSQNLPCGMTRASDAAGSGERRDSCSRVSIPVAPRPAIVGTSEHGVRLARNRDGYLHALEGPFGDHTGYYNEQRLVSGVPTSTRMTHRDRTRSTTRPTPASRPTSPPSSALH